MNKIMYRNNCFFRLKNSKTINSVCKIISQSFKCILPIIDAKLILVFTIGICANQFVQKML